MRRKTKKTYKKGFFLFNPLSADVLCISHEWRLFAAAVAPRTGKIIQNGIEFAIK